MLERLGPPRCWWIDVTDCRHWPGINFETPRICGARFCFIGPRMTDTLSLCPSGNWISQKKSVWQEATGVCAKSFCQCVRVCRSVRVCVSVILLLWASRWSRLDWPTRSGLGPWNNREPGPGNQFSRIKRLSTIHIYVVYIYMYIRISAPIGAWKWNIPLF